MNQFGFITKQWKVIVQQQKLVLQSDHDRKEFSISDIETFKLKKPSFVFKGYIQINLKQPKKAAAIRGEVPPHFIHLISKKELDGWKTVEQMIKRIQLQTHPQRS
ncbi:hypothetical protein [Desmospora profundinema]|uniref:Uncharacterized protein n=1 Tax=Desmospora profundinema TaxID=1571184 RepID=A0ABU1IHB7_9BACL|nr:hypothetical protein [Desmospora profundinema]MDR6224160.1 hypothetical protein [Desmospora profundinema]